MTVSLHQSPVPMSLSQRWACSRLLLGLRCARQREEFQLMGSGDYRVMELETCNEVKKDSLYSNWME